MKARRDEDAEGAGARRLSHVSESAHLRHTNYQVRGLSREPYASRVSRVQSGLP